MNDMINKTELAEVIAQVNGLTKAEANRQLDAVLAGMKKVISAGKGFNILGFFKCEVTDVEEKTFNIISDIAQAKAENRPVRTTVKPAHKALKFKVAKALKEAVNS